MKHCRQPEGGWVIFTTVHERSRRVIYADVAPVDAHARIRSPHILGPDCPCHPRADVNQHGVRTYIHDVPFTEDK